MKELDINTVESSELVEQTFHFWFNDNGHIRSPFPEYIRPELKRMATEKFYLWANSLTDKAKDELNDEMVGERFEEIIFETASNIVQTEEERITILYPFLPRGGDQLMNENGESGLVVDRYIKKDGDHNFLWVKCENKENGENWKTSFELPV